MTVLVIEFARVTASLRHSNSWSRSFHRTDRKVSIFFHPPIPTISLVLAASSGAPRQTPIHPPHHFLELIPSQVMGSSAKICMRVVLPITTSKNFGAIPVRGRFTQHARVSRGMRSLLRIRPICSKNSIKHLSRLNKIPTKVKLSRTKSIEAHKAPWKIVCIMQVNFTRLC